MPWEGVITIVLGIVGGIASNLVMGWLQRHKTRSEAIKNESDAQKSEAEAADIIQRAAGDMVKQQEKRIEVLERKVAELTREVASLTCENVTLKQQLREMEQKDAVILELTQRLEAAKSKQ